jgi:hypothetical protein
MEEPANGAEWSELFQHLLRLHEPMSEDPDCDDDPGDSDELPYRPPTEINFNELREVLGRLELF